ncbi:MAG: DUF3472 domain-containing protein [Planctomycetota bacterium]|nr:MAG: DUF3472 domain-containing protein [Planctomycetota bacterium]
MRLIVAGVLALILLRSPASADEKLKGIACRSIHLGYPAEEGISFYNEITVRESAEGTYFMVCGWGKGYFGIQELGNKKKVVLFSVWDPGEQNDPRQVQDDVRVKLLHKDDAVRVGRFGNEGTGGQSFFDYDWKVGETYRFLVTARAEDQRSEYAGYFYVPEEKAWKHLVTFSTPTGGDLLRGHYSFVEDFRRNRVSATQTRLAEFGPGWVQSPKGEWSPLKKARFTGDGNPVMNVDAGLREGRMFLATGGEISNTTIPLWKSMEQTTEFKLPTDLPIGEKKE